MIFPKYKKERELLLKEQNYFIVGCDEVGVGPLAGPVVAAACILNPDSIAEKRSKHKWYYRVRDSKTVNEKEREELVDAIKENCLFFGIGSADPKEIDEINIHHASLLAMKRAIQELLINMRAKIGDQQKKVHVLLDGRFVIPNFTHHDQFEISQEAIVDGDCDVLSIAAASIIAKVHRDEIMKKIHELLPHYGFDHHKGYNTKVHQQAIEKNGITEFHRKSFVHAS